MRNLIVDADAQHPLQGRQPKYLGTGIHMMYQFDVEKLIAGDWCFDADWGRLEWDGVEWK